MSLSLWKLKSFFRQCLITVFTRVNISRHCGHTTKKSTLSIESWMFQLSSGKFIIFSYHAYSASLLYSFSIPLTHNYLGKKESGFKSNKNKRRS